MSEPLSLDQLPDEAPVRVRYSEVAWYEVWSTAGALRAAGAIDTYTAEATPAGEPALTDLVREGPPGDLSGLLGQIVDEGGIQACETDGLQIHSITAEPDRHVSLVLRQQPPRADAITRYDIHVSHDGPLIGFLRTAVDAVQAWSFTGPGRCECQVYHVRDLAVGDIDRHVYSALRALCMHRNPSWSGHVQWDTITITPEAAF
jgi:hypothetical protein